MSVLSITSHKQSKIFSQYAAFVPLLSEYATIEDLFITSPEIRKLLYTTSFVTIFIWFDYNTMLPILSSKNLNVMLSTEGHSY